VERVTVRHAGRVQVVVPVEQWPGRKEVAVRVKLSGPPADGYRLSAVRSEPSTIVLQGDPAILSEVPGFVETEPLDLTDATADVRKRVALLLPEGVTSYDGDFVMATAGVTPIEGGITVAEPLVVRGLGAGLTAAAALDEVDVILSGPMPLLESMNEDDVFAILDLSGLVPGTHALKPSVVRPGGISLDGVIPETVEVVIRLQETGATGELPQVPDVEATAAAITPTATLTVAAAAGMTIPQHAPCRDAHCRRRRLRRRRQPLRRCHDLACSASYSARPAQTEDLYARTQTGGCPGRAPQCREIDTFQPADRPAHRYRRRCAGHHARPHLW
jgi:hypothetical protein